MSSFVGLGAQTINDIASYLGLPNGNDTERLLDWGEDTYPQVLSPTRRQTMQLEGYSYRYYSDTGVYVATKEGSLFHLRQPCTGRDHYSTGQRAYFPGPDAQRQIERVA